ncbi:MAG: hydrogen gas-evolving membrane-bound hydrogenase subunit E [Syntrophotaleaceae bacterium]
MKAFAFLATLATAVVLLYGTKDFAPWGDPASPASTHVSPVYIQRSVEETHVPNIVTAILGDYRGYDTMFETVVIYCAGLAVISILRRQKT